MCGGLVYFYCVVFSGICMSDMTWAIAKDDYGNKSRRLRLGEDFSLCWCCAECPLLHHLPVLPAPGTGAGRIAQRPPFLILWATPHHSQGREVKEEAEGIWQVAISAQALLRYPVFSLLSIKVIVGISTGAALSGVGSSQKNVEMRPGAEDNWDFGRSWRMRGNQLKVARVWKTEVMWWMG